MSDTLAYFSGKYLGKHLFSPSISPKKTWEGVAGGFTGAWIMGIGMLYFAGEVHWNWLILSAIISIFNQPGDLIESVIKRSVNKKDSGNLIPGHGGILDRVDSLLTIFPIIYFYQTFT
ncbi:MAG: phosphatidate cytidylyltransferase [Bacteroidia bacterium]|nr:phosphatidate cytidylyltransferase [Bacteroidia bacterium]